MEIKCFRSPYGYEKVKCPFCAKEVTVRDATKMNPDRLRDLKRHITNQASKEALYWFITPSEEQEEKRIQHLAYYAKHTQPKTVVVENKRGFDSDLTLTA